MVVYVHLHIHTHTHLSYLHKLHMHLPIVGHRRGHVPFAFQKITHRLRGDPTHPVRLLDNRKGGITCELIHIKRTGIILLPFTGGTAAADTTLRTCPSIDTITGVGDSIGCVGRRGAFHIACAQVRGLGLHGAGEEGEGEEEGGGEEEEERGGSGAEEASYPCHSWFVKRREKGERVLCLVVCFRESPCGGGCECIIGGWVGCVCV